MQSDVKTYDKMAATEKKIILAITLFYTAVFFYMVIKDYDVLWFSIQDLPNAITDNIAYLFPYLILPFGIITFWKRKKIGWILLTIFIAYTASVMMIELSYLVSWYYGNQEQDYLYLSNSMPVADIIQLLLFIITLAMLSKSNIRRIYFITRQVMAVVILASIVVAVMLTIL